MSARAWIGLGSNIDPARHLPAAVAALAGHARVVAVSRVWESPPADGRDDAPYCNAAVLVAADMSPADWWDRVLPAIEAAQGRVRDPADRYAARTLDCDLLWHDTGPATHGRHVLPDPDLFARVFVAVPLAELTPDLRVPGDDRTLAQIATDLGGPAALTARPDIVLPV